MARGKRRPRLGKTGCLFWLLILIVIVIVILYRGKGSFKDTFRSLKKGVERTAVVVEESVEKNITDEQGPVVVKEDKTAPEPSKEPDREPQKEPVPVNQEPKETPREEIKSAPEKTIKTKSLNATLYFVKIDKSDGSAKPFPVSRTVQYKDSPITRTMESLLLGSTRSEKENGIVSFIPAGTKLISAQISNGHLTLNFSGEIEQNYSGREAILLELSQIMLTSFSFDAVGRVSILIDGARKGYITGEGIPLKLYYTKQDISQLISGG
jgi:spore germination protein GerM